MLFGQPAHMSQAGQQRVDRGLGPQPGVRLRIIIVVTTALLLPGPRRPLHDCITARGIEQRLLSSERRYNVVMSCTARAGIRTLGILLGVSLQ